MILKSEKILDDLMNLRKNGYPPGADLKFEGFPLSFVKGGCTDITGYPFYGKSLVLKEFLVGLCVNHNWKHLVYMPDDGSDVDVASNLIHKLTGKSFNKDSSNYISEKEISKYYLTLTENFKFIDTSKNYAPEELWDIGKELGCDSVAIDSWNYLSHKGEPTKPEYLRKVLSYRNKFMQSNGMHAFTVVHPKNPDPMSVIKGDVKKPSVYDIMGGVNGIIMDEILWWYISRVKTIVTLFKLVVTK